MALSNIGSNATEEFFETILYGTAYAEAQDALRGVTQDIDNDLLQDAISGASSILIAGAMSVLIQKQEDLISNIFTITGAYITAVLGSEFFARFKNRIRGFKGAKLFRRLNFFNSGMSDRIALAQLGSSYNTHMIRGHSSQQNVLNKRTQVLNQKDYILKKENHQFQVGSEKAKSYQQTLLFKVLTKNFTANDQQIVKKILGNSNADMTDIDNLNQVADFMFVKDTDGNITGLTEQMFQLLNGLGYVHK